MTNNNITECVPGGQLRCPAGHTGPFRYVFAVEVWHEVRVATYGELVVGALRHSGNYGTDDVPNSEYLVCKAELDAGKYCDAEFWVPKTTTVDWEWREPRTVGVTAGTHHDNPGRGRNPE